MNPRYAELKHYPLEYGRYEGTGSEGRVITMTLPFTRLRIKQVWPRIDGCAKWVWIHQFETPQMEYTLSRDENSGDICEWSSFSALGGVTI